MSATDSTAAIEAVFRIEYARVIAGLARYVSDIDLAEELAQEALVDENEVDHLEHGAQTFGTFCPECSRPPVRRADARQPGRG